MSARVKRFVVALATVAAAAALPAVAAQSPAAPVPVLSAPGPVTVPCGAGTIDLAATWYFPGSGTPAQGLVWLQHGFFRQDAAAADVASKLARAGFVVFAPTIPSLRPDCGFNNLDFLGHLAGLFAALGAPDAALLQAARAAASTVGLPLSALPERYVFSGHSAGGAAVTFAGGSLVSRYPDAAVRLKGLVLLDPVESPVRSMRTALSWLADVPIYTIAAAPSACNANTSGSNELLALGRSFVGVQVTGGTHCDAEGASTDVLCALACGVPKATNVGVLQIFAIGWSSDLLLGRTTATLYPGGGFYDSLVAAGVIRTF